MKHKRTLAIFLSVVLLLGSTTFAPVNALQENKVIEPVPEPDTIVEQTPVPETIASIVREENNHVERLHTEEGDNLNSLVFQNEDGTKTMYIYDHPVKYRDDQGFVQDISLAIADSNDPSYPFRTQANSVVTEFPAVLSDGIVLSDNDVTLRLVAPPAEGNVALNHKARRLNTQTIAYTYDVKTTIEYGLTYTGFKEDIVVNEYTGQTEYPFILYTNGLELTTIDDSYYLIDDAGDVRASIGDIIVFTADERNNTYGTLQATTIKPGEIYALTIVLDAGYLSDPNTAYPIRIDPTVELVYTEDTPNAIEEKTLQSNNTTSGSNTATVIGKNAKGISRSIMKFPGLDFDSLRGVNVISAVVTLRDLMCESEEMTITCYPFTGGAWTEDNAQWANLTQSWGEALDSNVVSYANGRQQATAHRYSFDITDLAQKWMDGTADCNLGIIFRSPDTVENGTDYFYKTFGTSERASYKPTFTITYQDVFSLDRGYADVKEGNSISLTASSVLGYTGEISWISSDPEVATVSSSGNSSAQVQGLKAGETTITASCLDEDGNPMSESCTVYVIIPDGVYYISNISSNRCVTNYDSTVNSNSVYTTPQNTSTVAQPTQFWKITYMDSGWYAIRPVDRPLAVLSADNSNNVVVSDLTPNASIQILNRWKIEHNNLGYVFHHKGLSSASLTAPASNTAGAGLTTAAWSANSNCHWNLSSAKGVVLRDTVTGRTIPPATIKYLEQGHDYDLSDLKINWEYYGSLIGGQVWSGNNYNMVDVHSNTGQLTANNFGTSTVTIRTTLDGISYSASYNITVVLSSGTYFLRNKTTGMYADIFEHTMSNGTEIIQEGFLGNGTQRWVFTHLGDGTFTIHSGNSTTRFYLGVKEDSTAVNQPIVLRTGTVTDGMKWKIERTSSGAFKLTPKTGIANDYVLATSTSDATSGAALIQGAYFENESYRDEWLFQTYTLTLNLYYDYAFAARHSNPETIISQFEAETQELFRDLFAISVQFNLQHAIYSTPDLCKLENGMLIHTSTLEHMCPANPHKDLPSCPYFNLNSANQENCENCTSAYQIYRDFIGEYPGNDLTDSVLFTGSTLYDDDGIVCNRSYAWYNNGVLLQNIVADSEDYYFTVFSGFCHELAHTIGAEDHYHEWIYHKDGTRSCRGGSLCVQCNPTSGRPEWCYMSNGKIEDPENYDINNLFCPGCLADIEQHLAGHHLS